MSNNRSELIAYIKRLGYSEKIAEEVLRQRGDRISKSDLLNYVVIAASKNKARTILLCHCLHRNFILVVSVLF